MLSIVYVYAISQELEKLLREDCPLDDDAAANALRSRLRSLGCEPGTESLQEVLAFSIGYFTKGVKQSGPVGEVAVTYAYICIEIANGDKPF